MEIVFRSRWLRFAVETGRDDDDEIERVELTSADLDPAPELDDDDTPMDGFGFQGRRRG